MEAPMMVEVTQKDVACSGPAWKILDDKGINLNCICDNIKAGTWLLDEIIQRAKESACLNQVT